MDHFYGELTTASGVNFLAPEEFGFGGLKFEKGPPDPFNWRQGEEEAWEEHNENDSLNRRLVAGLQPAERGAWSLSPRRAASAPSPPAALLIDTWKKISLCSRCHVNRRKKRSLPACRWVPRGGKKRTKREQENGGGWVIIDGVESEEQGISGRNKDKEAIFPCENYFCSQRNNSLWWREAVTFESFTERPSTSQWCQKEHGMYGYVNTLAKSDHRTTVPLLKNMNAA